MKTIDCRGLSCPGPVVETKKALEASQFPCTILLDNNEAVTNVTRLLEYVQAQFSVEQSADSVRLYVTGVQQTTQDDNRQQTVFLVTGDTLGRGEEELGKALLKSFFHTLGETVPPTTIYFLNAGVKLTAGPTWLEPLQELAEQGWQLESCGTCLDYYQIKDQLRVGRVTNMYAIVQGMLSADKVISI